MINNYVLFAIEFLHKHCFQLHQEDVLILQGSIKIFFFNNNNISQIFENFGH